jgi:TRAP-type C4-dicarboxylate transport system permease small subunit
LFILRGGTMSDLSHEPSSEAFASEHATAADRLVAPIRPLLRWLGIILLTVMIAMPTVQVILREVLRSPFVGAEELARFMLICVVYITLPYVISSGASIRMEELLQSLPKRWQRPLHIVIAGTGTIAFGVGAISVAVATLRNLNNATPTLGAAIECAIQTYKAACNRPLYVTFAGEHSPDALPDTLPVGGHLSD